MHGCTHHIKVIPYTYHIRIRNICPKYRIRESSISIVTTLGIDYVRVHASHSH